jgi:hypothetical protein
MMGVPTIPDGPERHERATMREITEPAVFHRLCRAGPGYIYIDSSPAGAGGWQHNILHAARCGLLRRTDLTAPRTRYYAPTVQAATAWLTIHRPGAWTPCGLCKPWRPGEDSA